MPPLTKANQITSVYLYCDNNLAKLKICVIDYGVRNEDDTIDYEYVHYYIDLIP